MKATIKIDGKDFALPNSFDVKTWMELMKLEISQESNWVKALSIVTSVPEKELQGADPSALRVSNTFITAALLARKKVQIPNFEDLEFGQFVDLDIWIVDGVKKHLDEMIGILNPQITDAAEAMYIMDEFSKWRQGIFKSYKNLFGYDERESEEDEEESGPMDPHAYARSWFQVIVELANWDILRVDAVTEQPLRKTLNFMALKKQKNIEEMAAIQKQKQQYDIQRRR